MNASKTPNVLVLVLVLVLVPVLVPVPALHVPCPNSDAAMTESP